MEGQEEYEQAVELLEKLKREQAPANEYEQAIELLIKSYTLEFNKNEIYDFLYENLYKQNETWLRQRYEANMKQLAGQYSFIGDYDRLPFLIFPLTDDIYWLYYKDTRAFKPRNWLIYHDYLLTKLVVEAKPDFEWLKAELDEWENEEMAYCLLGEIEQELAAKSLTEQLVDKLAVYRLLSRESERSDLLYGQFYYRQKDYAKAEQYVLQGLRKRRLNLELNVLFADLKMLSQDYMTAIYHYLLMSKIGRSRKRLDLRPRIRACVSKAMQQDEVYQKQFKSVCALSLAKPNLYPFVPKISFGENDNLEYLGNTVYEESLKCSDGDELYCSIYNDRYSFGMFDVNKEALLQYVTDDVQIGGAFQFYAYRLLKGRRRKEYTASAASELVPVSTTARGQVLEFIADDAVDNITVGRQEMQYFKLRPNMSIRSNDEFVIGQPVNNGHAPNRRRLVINILVDALAFSYIKENQYQNLPNIMRFFSQGVIFDANYTPAEWTYPSFTAIQTGMRIDKTQIFHAQAMCRLKYEYKTLAEYLAEKDYFCVNVSDGIDQVFNGSCRGFRDSFHGYFNKAAESIERAVLYIEAFGENDLFINLHFDDVHMLYGRDYQVELPVQTSVFADERCHLNNEKSVRAEANKVQLTHYDVALKNIDRQLGDFFTYLERNYNDDEYIVCLYSDHGVSVFKNHIFTLSQSVSNTALMLRGYGVPKKGLVKDEVTSTIDLMAIMAKLLDFSYDDRFTDTVLPRAFGGVGREYALSQSIYPGQPYRMAINTLEQEYFFQSLEDLTYDGRVNPNRCLWECYNKDASHSHCCDKELQERFLAIYRQNIKGIADVDFEKIYLRK